MSGMQPHARDRGSLNASPMPQNAEPAVRPSRHRIPNKPSVEDYFNGSSSRLLPTPAPIQKSKSLSVGPSIRGGLSKNETSPHPQNRRSKPRSISSRNTFLWIKGDLIGKGSHGRVYLAFNATTGEIMAVKQVELPSTASDRLKADLRNFVEALRSERETLRDLDHENIVQYLGFEENPKTINIFLQYVSGGTIGGCLRNSGKFKEDVTKSFARQILKGLAYLHSKGILHRDMKSDNILVEETGICKISDFGISKKLEEVDRAFSGMKGTNYWMAPEVLATEAHGYDTKVDIWSLGCIVFEMWTAKRPWFQDFNILTVMLRLLETKLPPPLPEDLILSQLAQHFRQECFQFEPEQRPTAEMLLRHPYLELSSTWTFPGMSNISEPVPPTPAIEEAEAPEIVQIYSTSVGLEVGDSSQRSSSPALTMKSSTLGSSRGPRMTFPPRPISPPLVIIAPPPPRKPFSQESSVDWAQLRNRSSSITSESSSSQRSSQLSATTRSKRLVIHNPDTIPDLTKSKKRNLPEPPTYPPFVYYPPPLPEIGAPVPYSQQLAPLPQTRFPATPTIDQDSNRLDSARTARTQQFVSTFSLNAPTMPNRAGPANLQAAMAMHSIVAVNSPKSDFSSDRDSNLTSSTWQIRPQNSGNSVRRPLSFPASPLEGATPTQMQVRRGHNRVSSVIKDSRPKDQEVLKHLETYFPGHNLDEPVVESPVEPRFAVDHGTHWDLRTPMNCVLKSIKTIAEEQIHRGLSLPDRKRQTRLWDSHIEEIKAPP